MSLIYFACPCSLFKDVLDNAIVEIQQNFHISNEKLFKIVCEFTGGQHNVSAITLKSSEYCFFVSWLAVFFIYIVLSIALSRDGTKHFHLYPPAVSAVSIAMKTGAEGEGVGVISQRNRRY